MIYILYIFLFIVLSCILLLLGVDFYFFLMHRYCRYHIGRWADSSRWEQAVIQTAKKWVKKTPTVRITDNSRYVLLDIKDGKYRSQNIQSWQTAALILGLLKRDTGERDSAISAAQNLLNNGSNWKQSPKAVDAGMLALAVMESSRDKQMIKPAMDFVAALIESQTDGVKTISYTGGKDNPERYVDTLGLACPFLAAYAKEYQCAQYADLAFRQLEFYHTYGLYHGTELPNHAIDVRTKTPLGVYGWGRGTAWYVIGLLDTLRYIQNEEQRNSLKQWIHAAAECYIAYQRDDGGFGSILQRKTSYDSSATAALAWFYYSCAKLFDEEKYIVVADKCIQKLKKETRITGAIDWCQGDTKDIGIFAQTYDLMPFAQGMTIRALNARDGTEECGY